MITEQAALELVHKYGMSKKRLEHSIGVAAFAYELAACIHKRHPELSINPQKVRIAALLHDIGRCIPGDHELNTVHILKSEGLEEIASITIHGSIYEIMLLRGKDDPSLIPQSIENKIVAYSDGRFTDRVVTMEDRWREIENRRKDETEKITSLQMAKERFMNVEKELMALSNDK
jgi:putative nucleotidyltransferase with HDIG domain